MVELEDGLVAPDGDPRWPVTRSAPTAPDVGLLL
jgi:hypothetical protein